MEFDKFYDVDPSWIQRIPNIKRFDVSSFSVIESLHVFIAASFSFSFRFG